MSTIRIAIASDVHAHDSPASDTHVITEPPASRPRQHPLSDLLAFVRTHSITADYLFAPGDLTNQANHEGLAYAWRRLHELATSLGARLIAVPGNHDVITRVEAADRRAPLRNLVPSFPVGDLQFDTQFWDHGWVLLEYPDHRILLLDSTRDFPSFPAGVDTASPEWATYLRALDRGSFSEQIQDAVDSAIANLPLKLNIAMVHHHPQEHQLRSHLQDTYGPMVRGGELIDTLSRYAGPGRWILIHGHKHIPQLAHGISATSNGPLIMCAASLGGKLWNPINTVTRNQFHLLTAHNSPLPGTASIRGTVESFTWGYGEGWAESERRGAGLPASAGFGCSDDFRIVAARLEAVMIEEGREFMSFEALEGKVPQLPYLLPTDFQFLEEEMASRGYGFQRDRLNHIVQLVREATPS